MISAGVMPRKFKTLDVRPILTTGAEPFSKTRESIDALAENEGLSVIAPLLPSGWRRMGCPLLARKLVVDLTS